MSLHPYFGTLLPCLKEMTKDFVKFLALVFVLYLGKFSLQNFSHHDPRADRNRLQHDVWISCPRNIHFSRDELDSNQSILRFELFRFCTRCLLPADLLRLANVIRPQDVAEQVFPAPYTFSAGQVLTSRRYRRRWARRSCLFSVLLRTSCCSLS